MKESQISMEVSHLLRRLWFWPVKGTDLRPVLSKEARVALNLLIRGLGARKSPLLGQALRLKGTLQRSVSQPPSGRPDILCLSPKGVSIVVEVKSFPLPRKGQGWAATSFPFSEISRAQRRWLDVWQSEKTVPSSSYGGGAYIALGTRHGRVNSKTKPRILWLVGWPAWKAMESIITPHQNSLPLTHKRHLAKVVQEQNYTARGLLDLWRCYWARSCWHLKDTHPLFHSSERDLDEFQDKWRVWDEDHEL